MTAIQATDLSIKDKILLACAANFDGLSELTDVQVVLSAWEDFPETFSLGKGIGQHPDSNKVLSYCMGSKGLVTSGYLVRLRPKVYAITALGRRRIAELKGEAPAAEQRNGHTVHLIAAQQRFLRRVSESSAMVKMDSGRQGDVTFKDACQLWTLDGVGNVELFDACLKAMTTFFTAIELELEQLDWTDHAGRVWTAGDVRVLRHHDEALRERFQRHLSLLRNRLEKS